MVLKNCTTSDDLCCSGTILINSICNRSDIGWRVPPPWMTLFTRPAIRILDRMGLLLAISVLSE